MYIICNSQLSSIIESKTVKYRPVLKKINIKHNYQQLLYVILPSSSLESSKKGEKYLQELLYMQVYHHSIPDNRACVVWGWNSVKIEMLF